MGSETVVLLNSVGTIKEAFAQMGHSFSDRPHILFIDYITEGNGLYLYLSNMEYFLLTFKWNCLLSLNNIFRHRFIKWQTLVGAQAFFPHCVKGLWYGSTNVRRQNT